jgi:rare lipoprotein A
MVVVALSWLTGCAGHRQARVSVPPPPPAQPQPAPTVPPEIGTKKGEEKPSPEIVGEDEVITIPADAVPLSTETGMASWYGAPYHNRRGSNGELYNMHAMTAAHRTLPLGTIVRVTNLKTGSSELVRITDRGPFVEGRILDLSYAAAKKLDVWQPGVARVKVEVMQIPSTADSGGRWAVQIGSFENQKDATELADHLARRYQTAKVAKFVSPVGTWWVRVRVLNDDRKRAEDLVRETETPEGAVYLVRLD